MKAIVFLEQRNGTLKKSSLEALTVAHKIAGNADDVAGVIIGSNPAELVAATKGFGAAKIYTVSGEAFDKYNVMNYAKALEAACDAFSADTVIGIASPMGRDLFPRLAARKKSGILTDLIEFRGQGQLEGGKKPMYAGKVIANVSFQNSPMKFATLRPNVFAAEQLGGDSSAEALQVEAISDAKLVCKEIRKGQSDKTDLTEAVRIISGGRAMGNAENFKVLNECAETIGATVGASRAAVDSGYATHDMQVGQTGKTVNPQLYIACGISGSIQHMAGMRTSKVIVAINTDADAPIFSVADYGIVGDLFEAVPLLQKKFSSMIS